MSVLDAAHPRYENVCVVGLGNHARTKILPALVSNRQNIVALVTSQSRGDLPEVPIFRSIDDALNALTQKTLVFLATPPRMHFEQAMASLAAGHDVMVEKPAFVTEKQVDSAFGKATSQAAVLIEAFMHRHTKFYSMFLSFWHAQTANIRKVEIEFFIPELPSGTFRTGNEISGSSLYDMGCYGLSLLSDMDIPLDILHWHLGRYAVFDSMFDIRGAHNGMILTLRGGVAPTYTNLVRLHLGDGKTVTFSPFFYGRQGPKHIVSLGFGDVQRKTIIDDNAFAEILAVPRVIWSADQSDRWRKIASVTSALERLGQTAA